jgi:ribokinase
VLYENGEQVARSASPMIDARDGTGAGDAFTACLLVGLIEERPYEEALQRACFAGAYTAAKVGAQSALPDAVDLESWLKKSD